MTRRPFVNREQSLMLASLAAVTLLVGGLVVLRLAMTGRASFGFLGWNTFLAWLPIVFALAWARSAERRPRGAITLALAGAWLVFLPNAGYLITDLQHFNGDFAAPRWYDALLFGANAINGVLLGSTALALAHRTLDRTLGVARAWIAIVIVCGLCGFGIYLGRFIRLNSWDVLTNPLHVVETVGAQIVFPFDHPRTWFVTLVAGGIQLLCYLTLRAAAAVQRAAILADRSAAT